MPAISVIIPVYNGEKTIQETINSVLNQTFSDFELIVINDGSQDRTLAIIENIKDCRLQAFSYLNAGLAASRNRGIAQAVGKYISFIDADDLWTVDKLEAQFNAMQRNPEAAVAYSWTDHINELGQFVRRGSHINLTGNVYEKLLELNFLENGSNALICKQALLEVGGFDESLAAAEDWDIFLRLAARYEFVVVSCPQILYRVSPTSMSTKLEKQEAATLQVIEKAFTHAPEYLQILKKRTKSHLYKYLTYKSLEGVPDWKKNLKTARLFWHTLNHEPSLLSRKVTWKIFLRIMLTFFLPTQLAMLVLSKRRQLSNIEDLFISK